LRSYTKSLTLTLDAAALRSSAVVPNYLGPDHDYLWRRDALTMSSGPVLLVVVLFG
jgi:hypothetical protein